MEVSSGQIKWAQWFSAPRRRSMIWAAGLAPGWQACGMMRMHPFRVIGQEAQGT